MEEQTKNQALNPYLIPASIIVAGIIIAGAIAANPKNDSTQVPGGDVTQEEELSPLPEEPLAPEEQTPEVSIEFEGFAVMGDSEAPVTMVEYSDFACPFCARFWQETEPLIKRDYIDTGKVRFVYKDFIVVGGDRGAEAAYCAQEQGKFWEYHDILFENQSQDRSQWSNSEVHRKYAQELGLDEDALIECFESRRYQDRVESSTAEALKNGGRGTPYFLINDQPIAGAQPYSVFQEVIDSFLAEQ